MTDMNLSVNNPTHFGHEVSMISGVTGNKGPSLRLSNPGDYKEIADDDIETLEQRINKEIRSQGR